MPIFLQPRKLIERSTALFKPPPTFILNRCGFLKNICLKNIYSDRTSAFLFETFGRWLKNSFFRKTDEYSGVTWLNRHLFAHGTASSWQQSANFSRLIVALATLGIIKSWHDDSHRVSLFLPR